jgi:hypothetical protein
MDKTGFRKHIRIRLNKMELPRTIQSMKSTILIFLTLFTSLHAKMLDAKMLEVSTEDAFKTAAQADMVVTYQIDGKLDINIGIVESKDPKAVRKPIYFDLVQLESFFKHQKHMNLIVVILAKNTWEDKKISEVVEQLNSYFFQAGYSRVVIQQGLGGGRGTYSDKTNPRSDRK